MPVSCSYCGATHPDAQGVRDCWNTRNNLSAGAGGETAAEALGEDFWGEQESWEPTAPRNGLQVPAQPERAAVIDSPAQRSINAILGRPASVRQRPVSIPGHPAPFLGRSVLVNPGAPAPAAWADRRRVGVGPQVSGENLAELEGALLSRTPLVIELDPEWEDSERETETGPVWSLHPGYSFPGERLRHLLFSNSLDARGAGEPGWRLSAAAVELGARPGGPADVLLADGTPAFIDGGPLTYFSLPSGPAPAAVIPRVALENGRLSPFGSNDPLPGLAPDQQAAVAHTGGSARILAPAGSGKTRVLTERTRHLLKNWGIPASALCLVAFNKRAADQMSERTADLRGLQIRTLNSLGLAILSGSGRFGEGRAVQTVDESTVRRILEDLVSFPRRANTDPAAAWLEALSTVRLGLKSPEQVELEFSGDVDGLPGVFEKYRAALADRGVVDFDEQIYRAIEILLTKPEVRERARPACRVMLVDEFQDLTPAHLLLIRLLAGPGGCVFGVGDDDQTIYGYTGASPGWLIDYESYFPGSGSHLLEVNYRCPPAVTRAARTLLTHNRLRVPKSIVSPAGAAGDGDPSGLRTEIADDPVSATVAAVGAHLESGAPPTSVTVLTRVNSSLAPIQLSLLHAGIPVNRAVDTRFMERTGVRAALAWLSIANNPGRLRGPEVSFTARRPPRALSPKVIEWMSEQRSVERLRSLAERLGERDAQKVNTYADAIERLVDEALSGTTADILRCLRDEVGLAAAMEALDTEHRRLDRSPQTDDLDVLIALGKLHPDPTGFGAWLKQGLSAPSDPMGVTLATIHAVKGREWDHVVIHDASEGLIPHRLAFDVEEERRVFHVALTRSRRSTTVVAGPEPSPFLAQLSTEWVPGSEPLSVFRRAPVTSAAPAAPAPGSAKAFELLKAWRLERSRSEGKPAYTVFHDSTLEAIAASGARSLGDLARIKGVGPAKLQNFGDEILAVLDSAL